MELLVAREYGIPAVANIAGITKILKDNDIATINGYKEKL